MNITESTTPEEFFRYILKDHSDAVALLVLMFSVLHTWDDIADGDKPIALADVHQMMYLALVVIPRNAFYRDHFTELNVLLESAITNWHAANELEHGGSDDDKRIAFVIRSNYCNVALAAARIVGGHEWAKSVAPTIRRFWHREGYFTYLKNLSDQLDSEKESVNVLRRRG